MNQLIQTLIKSKTQATAKREAGEAGIRSNFRRFKIDRNRKESAFKKPRQIIFAEIAI